MVGRARLGNRRLQRSLRQTGLEADHRDRRVGRDRDRPAAVDQRNHLRVVEDRLELAVLALHEADLPVQLAEVLAVGDRAKRPDRDSQDGQHDERAVKAWRLAHE